MRKVIDLTGRPFGRLTAIERANNKDTQTQWKCLCDCGKIVVVAGSSLRGGVSKSCGCLRKEITAANCKKYLEDDTQTRLYKIWSSMKTCTENERVKSYKDYGGRGIYICKEWKDSFLSFKQWALNHGYQNDLTIDRIDNEKGYFPENCRWVNRTVQNSNKRNNHYLSFQGQTKTLTEWAKEYGLKRATIRTRLKLGWDIEKALTTPVKE